MRLGCARSQYDILCFGQEPITFEGGNPHSTLAVAEQGGLNMSVQPTTIVPQSGEAFSVTTGTRTTTSENVEFMDNNPAFNYVVSNSDDPTRGIADMGDASLGEFLSRPILIADYAWAPSVLFFETFNPWKLFLENPRNVNRIANFNLFRSRLCVKFLVNGNGFYYGRLMASYNPLPNYDDVTTNRGLGLDADNIGASQRPHIYINPTECQGGDLCLPFVHWQNAVTIPASQWGDLGEVTVRTLSDLKNANGATDEITLSVFAYLEDANMAIPTSSNPTTITPQSADEYGDNPVSGPASTVARVAGKLTNIPVIAPFARATELAAGAVGGIAKLFGMSRPTVIDPIQVYRPEYVGGLANTNIPDGTNKLSMDVKQEVTIDPSVVGVGSEDEMGLVELAKRESYYTAFGWDPAGGVRSGPGTMLFRTQVMPTLFQRNQSGASAPNEYHMTPAGYVALPFDFWGGSMEFRFQVVCSNFHRGRIRVVWDPHDLTQVSNLGYNTAYNRIIDITDMKDFTFKVGWGREYSFLPVQSPTALKDGVPMIPFQPNAGGQVISNVIGNGTLSVYVVNDLTVPNTDPGLDNSIEINVFTRMCDDARFAQPADMNLRSVSYFRPPDVTTITPQADVMEEQEMAPVSQGVDTSCASDQPVSDHMMSVFYGEEITSIRQMLKRYCFHSLTPMDPGKITTVTKPDFPYYYGYNPDSMYEDTAGQKYAYCSNTYLNYFTPAFVAYRGGLRWKQLNLIREDSTYINLGAVMTTTRESGIKTNNTIDFTAYKWYRPYELTEIDNYLFNLGANKPLAVAGASNSMSALTVGGFVTPTERNPAIEVDLPFYNNRRFMCARRIRNLEQRNLDDEHPPVHTTQNIGRSTGVFNYVAAAEDFSLSFFIGVPIMYSVGTDIAAQYPVPPAAPTS